MASNPAFVTLTAFAGLESPRRAPGKPNTVIFDGQIWLEGDAALTLGLRYYNSAGMDFEDVGTYLITAHVAKFDAALFANLAGNPESVWTADDYDLYGEIIHIVPLHDVPEKECEMIAKHPIMLQVTGMVSMAKHEPQAEFSMTLSVTFGQVPPGVKLTLPLNIYISNEDLRWKDKNKPLPRIDSQVAVAGFVTGITGRVRADDKDYHALDHIDVQLQSIVFLPGKPTVTARSGPSTPMQSPNGKLYLSYYAHLQLTSLFYAVTPKKTKYSFGNSEQGSPSKRPRVESSTTLHTGVSTRSKGNTAGGSQATTGGRT
ncbi:hypothetical protein BC629DRAFT_1526614 [Irpex lacteus]|nr:hypothetical protein BC629DRAFT_1526614 [Irpex lacteus]